MNSESIKKRVFLVGCSRSGTTISQVLVAGHSAICSFPETFFFIDSAKRFPWQYFLPSNRYKNILIDVLKRIQREDLSSYIPGHPITFSYAADIYTRILDSVAKEQNKDIWLEKSPMHVLHIDVIQQYVPNCHFIHVLRDGRDVVASIRDRSIKYPNRFGHEHHPDIAVKRWNKAIRSSKKYFGMSGHTFILYDKLIEHLDTTLDKICSDLNILFEPTMKETGSAYERVVPSHLAHLNGTKGPIVGASSKFEKLFDIKTQEWINEHLNTEEYMSFRKEILSLA